MTALANVEDVYPLSPLQQGMLFHTIAEPGSGVFVNQISSELVGDLDPTAFKAAWDDLVARHAILRTAFVWDGVDQPLQVVRETADLEWFEADWSDLDGDQQARRLADLLVADRRRGFDLTDAPLTRMMMVRTGAASWRWVWTKHHLVVDGWSAQILLDELRTVYDARQHSRSVALAAPFRYRDFIEHVTGADEELHRRFWRDRLAGFDQPHRLAVPALPPAPGSSGHASSTVVLDPTTTGALADTARRERVTINTVVQGAWALLLSRWTRQEDVVFGVTTAGRDAALDGVESAVGLFINTLPSRVAVDPRRSLGDWLRALQADSVATRAFEHSSLASVQRWSDVPPGEALFESIFVFENYPSPGVEREVGFRWQSMDYIEQSNYPLAVLAIPAESLTITFVYDTTRLSSGAVTSLGSQLAEILRQFAGGGDRRLAAMGLLDREARIALQTLSEGAQAVDDDRCIHDIIEEVGRRNPGENAVIFESQTLTYEGLLDESELVAARLRAAGVGPNRLVGLHLLRSTRLIVGLLGILRAGGAYVPLDPEYPADHVGRLLADDAIDVVLTDRDHAGRIPPGVTVVRIDDDRPVEAGALPRVRPDDLAYVIHTSGSTGRPKGVTVSHRNLVASTLAREVHYGGPVGRFLLLSSFAFDSSVAGIFWTLCSGGTLVLPSPGLEQDVHGLATLAARQRVTHLLGLPALYQLLLEGAPDGALASLEVAIVAGEASPSSVVEAHFATLPDAELHNEYGPTEATVWATVHRATPRDIGGQLPIGQPIAGATVYLLDQSGHQVPAGFAGELCVGGPGVTAGYLGRPDLTAERFVMIDVDGHPVRVYRTGDLASRRPDGTMLFHGRVDRQLKIRGHRVETAAVEAALAARAGVDEAAVTARALEGRTTARLLGYVVGDVDVASLRESLLGELPEFMVPDVITVLAALPRLPNGKIDYPALPDPRDHADAAVVAPRTETETILAEIWAELLQLDRVGVRQDFFALGGDSIVSIQMISRARQRGIQIEPGQITSYPTIEGLAAASGSPMDGTDDDVPASGPVPLAPIQRWFFNMDPEVPQHWNLSALFELAPSVDLEALRSAIRACFQAHDMLRARFWQSGGQWHQEIGDAEVELEVREVDEASFEVALHDLQSGLDLSAGRVVRALVTRDRDRDRRHLLLAVHHLVVDAVSWGILTADIDAAYQQAAGGQPIDLPARTASYRAWVEDLTTRDWEGGTDYWASLPPFQPIPRDHPGDDAGREGTARYLTSRLGVEETRLLTTSANDAYQTRTQDLLVAGLGAVLAEWTGSTSISLALEGHGRPEHIDVSRTVGWFTAAYPLVLTVPTGDAELIKTVKEQLRAVPDRGISYGPLRYLHGDERLAGPEPGVLFNYLGTAARPGGMLTPVAGAAASSRDPRNPRSHLLPVVASIVDGSLTVEWQFTEDAHDEATIKRLADQFLAVLERLVTHCLDEATGGFTPSDFPEAGLNQEELDAFLDELS